MVNPLNNTSDGSLTGSSGGLWVDTSYDLSAYRGPAVLRFRYRTDSYASGRGWYVDSIQIKDARGVAFKDGGSAGLGGVANGWSLSSD